jgi:hypothetical protein
MDIRRRARVFPAAPRNAVSPFVLGTCDAVAMRSAEGDNRAFVELTSLMHLNVTHPLQI